MTKTPPPAPPESRELLSGLVERVTFHNPDTGFCVLRVQARGRRELVTVVGHAAAISAGEQIQASGCWVNDRRHGVQFRSAHLRSAAPTTTEGIVRYLASGMVKGIGPHFARRLVDAFGEAVFDVVEREPSRLRDVEGIGPVRARAIAESWREQRAIRDIMVFLHSHGVSTARAVRIFRTYGPDAIALVSDDPYRLARDIRGIGFLTADTIARRLGIPPDAMVRLRAGVRHVLAEALDEGHCGLPQADLCTAAAALLDAPAERVSEALSLERADGGLVAATVAGTSCVFLAGLFHAEQQVADRLRHIARRTPPWRPIDVDRALPWVQQQLGVRLAAGQAEALGLALQRPLLVITGGPGVGKTTLLRAIVRVLAARRARIALCAPTGRAARRLTEVTGVEAKTIHRLLEVDPRTGGFKRTEANPLAADLVVVDETSMVDVLLMDALLRAVPRDAAVLLVGDVDQLPSVGPGQVLADVIGSGAVPVVRLTEVFRQAAESRIVLAAHRVNEGQMPAFAAAPDAPNDFFFIDADSPEDGVHKILQVVRERIPQRFGFDPIADVQVLCPMNRGALGARALNLELQRTLNPAGTPKVERFGWTYAVGDKVMQNENDYDKDVYNGDLGIVSAIDEPEQRLIATFDGRIVPYDFGELDRLALAYATTIHKAQGSEYPAVVIPVTTQHYVMLQRNLIYTGITRGKKLVVLVGQKRALAIAVRGVQTRRRWARLRELLAAV